MSILLIDTGGTIGMVETPDGFAPSDEVVEEELCRLKRDKALPCKVDLLRLDPLLDSANAQPDDWTRLARTLVQHYGDYDAFVVTHGTDTLAYSAAALCFALQGVAKPVILTGSMVPLTVPGNDGHRNLRDALWSATTAQAGVWVQFSGKLMHGARVTKAHSRASDAFTATAHDAPPHQTGQEVCLHPFGDYKVAVLTVSPGVPAELIGFAADHLDGIVLRCYGAGTVPDDPALDAALRKAQDKDVPVLAVSECLEGGMNFHAYASGKILRENGVIDGRDITYQAAYAKLHHALARTETASQRKAMLEMPLCGEMLQEPE